jgi:hypothetical protein
MLIFNTDEGVTFTGETDITVRAYDPILEHPDNDAGNFAEAPAHIVTGVVNIGSMAVGPQQDILCEGSLDARAIYDVDVYRDDCSDDGAAFDVRLGISGDNGLPAGLGVGFDDESGVGLAGGIAHFAANQDVIHLTMLIFNTDEGVTFTGETDIVVRAYDPSLGHPDNDEGDYAEAPAHISTEDCGESVSKSVTITNSAELEIPVEDPIVNVKAYPNPFDDFIIFEFSSPDDTGARLEIYNVLGEKIDDVFNGRIDANRLNSINYIPEIMPDQLIIYRMTIGLEVHTGILMHKK